MRCRVMLRVLTRWEIGYALHCFYLQKCLSKLQNQPLNKVEDLAHLTQLLVRAQLSVYTHLLACTYLPVCAHLLHSAIPHAYTDSEMSFYPNGPKGIQI